MPWNSPTLKQVRERVRDNVAAHLPGADAAVPNSNLRVISEGQAGLAFLHYEYLRWAVRQLLVATAETEFLDDHANFWLQVPRKDSSFAEGEIGVTGAAGVVIPAGTVFRTAGGIEFESLESVVASPSEVRVRVRAVTAGDTGNVAAGAVMRLVTAIPGVQAQATARTEFVGGADPELDDELRERVRERMARVPRGGSLADYVAWAKEVPGITRAWAVKAGTGTVIVRVMADRLRATAGGIPNADDTAAVAAHIDTVRPTGATDIFVLAPVPHPITVRIANLQRDTASTRAAIEANLRKLLVRRATPGQTIWQSWVSEAVSFATGEDWHNLTFENAVMPTNNHIAVLESVRYGYG